MNEIIKYRGFNMNNEPVIGFLTKKKIRSSGRISWAIAVGDCSLAETIPISDDFAPVIGKDPNGDFICSGDVIEFKDGEPLSAELAVVLVDKFGKHHFAPKEYKWFVGSNKNYLKTVTMRSFHGLDLLK